MTTSHPEKESQPETVHGDRLESWKEIATYLKRDVTTVQRWEKREGLPIRRHVHDKKSSVYAHRSELDEWFSQRQREELQEPLTLQMEERTTEFKSADGIREAPRPWRSQALWWVLVILTAFTVGMAVWNLKPTTPRPVIKTIVGVEPAEWLGIDIRNVPRFRLSRTAMALSPDDKNLVFCAGDSGGSRLYLRPMVELEAEPMPGTEGGVGPFFSRDGEWIAFYADGKLKKVRLDGGPPVTLCGVSRYSHYGASWGPGDTIVFGQHIGGILGVAADGGETLTITTLAEGEYSHRLPHFLPDGETLLYTSLKRLRAWDEAEIVAYSLETGERKVLIENGTDARYVPTGHLVFARLGTLMAVPFDSDRLEVTGGPIAIIGNIKQALNAVNSGSDTGAAQFTFSASGSLAYVPGGIFPDPENSLVWVDREGTPEASQAPAANYVGPRLSPDGRRVAVGILEFLRKDIWVYDNSRATSTRLTVEKSYDNWPAWTPDGARITFSSNRSGHNRIYEIPVDGSGSLEQLTTVEPALPASWSRDGQLLAFIHREDIWVLPHEGEPRPFIESQFRELFPTFSPDGRWLAYRSNQSGRREIYVTPYPGPGPRHQISTEGGREPVWAPNGRELFYRSLRDGERLRSMMAVDITTEPTFAAGKPKELFKDGYRATFPLRNYDVAPDGRSFLMVQPHSQDEKSVTQIHIVLNWFEELKRLVPTN